MTERLSLSLDSLRKVSLNQGGGRGGGGSIKEPGNVLKQKSKNYNHLLQFIQSHVSYFCSARV